MPKQLITSLFLPLAASFVSGKALAQDDGQSFFVTTVEDSAANLTMATFSFEAPDGGIERVHLYYPVNDDSNRPNSAILGADGLQRDVYLYLGDELIVGPEMRFRVSGAAEYRDIRISLTSSARLSAQRRSGSQCTIDDENWLTIGSNAEGEIETVEVWRARGCVPVSFSVPTFEQNEQIFAEAFRAVDALSIR